MKTKLGVLYFTFECLLPCLALWLSLLALQSKLLSEYTLLLLQTTAKDEYLSEAYVGPVLARWKKMRKLAKTTELDFLSNHNESKPKIKIGRDKKETREVNRNNSNPNQAPSRSTKLKPNSIDTKHPPSKKSHPSHLLLSLHCLFRLLSNLLCLLH